MTIEELRNQVEQHVSVREALGMIVDRLAIMERHYDAELESIRRSINKEKGPPEYLSQAFNEGDGTYKP